MLTLIGFRDNLLLLVIGLYLVLNYGFMQVRIPPGADSGLPLGELVLLFSMMTINYGILLPRLSATVFLIPFLIWWVLGFSLVYSAVHEYGFWALRDANHVIESLFLIVGFAFASRPQFLERFFRWLKI